MRHASMLAGLFASATAVCVAVPAHAEDYVQVGVGVDYSSGDYGTIPDTNILAVPVTFKLKQGDFFVRASLPYLHVEGPTVPGDGGGLPGPGLANSRDGIGDLTVAAGYSLPLGQNTFFDLSGRVKLPTASQADGLGTGTTDVTAEAELTQVLGSTSVSLRGGRRFNGSNAQYPLADVWQAGAGIYHAIGDLTLGLDYDWRDAALPTAFDRSELAASVGYKLNAGLRLQGYAYTGLTDGSPNLGGGVQLLYRFGQ